MWNGSSCGMTRNTMLYGAKQACFGSKVQASVTALRMRSVNNHLGNCRCHGAC